MRFQRGRNRRKRRGKSGQRWGKKKKSAALFSFIFLFSQPPLLPLEKLPLDQAAARAASAGADTPGGGLTPADLARLRAARAAEKEGAAPSSSSGGGGAGMGSGLFGDVLAEAKLIEWPSLKQALGDTVLVVGIVLGSALLLFVVNTLLADLSKVIY
jgi:preprotein translocase SecE subunit